MTSVVGFDPVVALLDSGAGETEFATAAVATLVGATADGGRGVSGVPIAVTSVGDQIVAIGDARRRLAELSVRQTLPTPDGADPGEEPHALVGMDCMRGTALTVGPRRLGFVRWFISPTDGPAPGFRSDATRWPSFHLGGTMAFAHGVISRSG